MCSKYAVIVLLQGRLHYAWIAAAIDFSIANRSSGPNILLSALTVIGTSAVFDASVNRALAIGMTVVVDAGNQGTNACDNSPADVAVQLRSEAQIILITWIRSGHSPTLAHA